MNILEKAKEIIKENIRFADAGIFDSSNTVGDPLKVIYDAEGLVVKLCYDYGYFEVFGLTKEEFRELGRFYEDVLRGRR